ncbi:MAG: hypothetical protein WB643_13285, partial [Candidatus Bathyarchaeia archaeon]
IGLGQRETHQQVYKVTAPIVALDRLLSETSIRRAYDLKQRNVAANGRVMFYRNDEDNDYQFFVVLAAISDRATLVDFEGYEIGRYEITGSRRTEKKFDRDVRDIVKDFRAAKYTVKPEDYEELGVLKNIVERIVLAPTSSKTVALSKLPKRTISILLGIVALSAAAYLIYVDKAMSTESFLTAVFGLGSLLVGLIPFMKFKSRGKGWVQLD